MKKYINFALLFCLSQLTLAQFEGYEKATTNRELIAKLENDMSTFNRFLNIFETDKEVRKPKKVKALQFKFNQTDFDKDIEEKSHYNFTFSNVIEDDKIELYIYKDPKVYYSLGEINAKINPTKVYYHDGSTEIIDKKINLSSHFSNDLNLKKAAKQFDAELLFSSPKQLDSIIVPAKDKLVTKSKDFTFEIVKQDNQSIILKTTAKDLDFIEIQAKTKENIRISNYGYSRTSVHPDVFKTSINKLISQVNKVLATAKKDSLMEHEKFKTNFISNLNNLKKDAEDIFEKESNEVYLKYDFGAPIKELILYYNDGIYERKVNSTFTLKNNQTLLDDSNNQNISIYDLDKKLIAKLDANYYALNEYFYESDNQYYFFDKKQRKMTALPYYKIEVLTNNFILAQNDDESGFELIDSNNQKIMKVDQYYFDKDFEVALLKSNNRFYVLNRAQAELFEIKNVDEVRYAEKGFFVAVKNNKYGFFDQNGKNIIPIEYDDVVYFDDFVDMTYQDYLFGVKKNDKWGYVNSDNKTIIPFQYSNLLGPFSYGIAPVYFEGNLGLINLKNQKLTKFTGSNYSSSSNFGRRALSLSDGYYNYKGELENK